VTAVEKATWEQFRAAVAEISSVPEDGLGCDSRLIADLQLDSLALAEVLVLLTVDFEMDGLADQLAERDWNTITLGALYEEYKSGKVPLGTTQHVIRARR
jgi:hypothetical protein